MTSPKVSVIVPVYNADKYLRRCIDSILSQTFADFELLLVDDGSTDGSPAICDAYAARDPRVRVFHKPNGGVSSARNLGLDNARGEWITFCDADDYVLHCWLDIFLSKASEYDLIVQGFKTTCPYEGIKERYEFGITYTGDVKEGLVELQRNYCLGYLWVKMFRAVIIHSKGIRFDNRIALREDEDFVLTYAKYCHSMVSTQQTGYMYTPFASGKYNEFDFYMAETLLKRSLELYGRECCDMVVAFANLYTDSLYDVYQQKTRHRRKMLRRYRHMAGPLILKTRAFAITRYMMYLDKSCILSSMLLDFHTRITSKIKNK